MTAVELELWTCGMDPPPPEKEEEGRRIVKKKKRRRRRKKEEEEEERNKGRHLQTKPKQIQAQTSTHQSLRARRRPLAEAQDSVPLLRAGVLHVRAEVRSPFGHRFWTRGHLGVWVKNPDGRNPFLLHRFETMVETKTFVGIYRGIESFWGFLSGAGFRPSTVCTQNRTLGVWTHTAVRFLVV